MPIVKHRRTFPWPGRRKHGASPRPVPSLTLVNLINGRRVSQTSRIGITCGLVAVSAALNLLTNRVMDPGTPFFIYLPAVLAASLFCGFGQGLLASLLSLAAAFYLNAAPRPDAPRMAAFAAVAILICVLNRHLRRATGALADAESRFRLLIDGIRDHEIFVLDPEGVVLNWNEGAELISGWKAAEAVGRHISSFYPADVPKDKPKEDMEAALARGRFVEEGWRARKDGRRFWARNSLTAVRDAAGNLLGFSNVTRDLTSRKLAEDQLRQTEERFRLLVTRIKDYAIFMLDPDGRVVTWNEGAERLKGYGAEEIIGQHFSRFYREQDRPLAARALEIAAEEGEYQDEGWRVRKDGMLFWASGLITAIRDDSGKLAGFAKVTRDLSERKAKDEALEIKDRALLLRTTELERAVADLEGFSHAVSHDLRAPLRAMQGFSHLVLQKAGGRLDGESRDLLERIGASATRMDQLIRDLLTYAKTARAEFKPGPVDLDEIVRRLVDDLALRDKSEIEVKAPLGRVVGLEPLVIQAVSNLLDNARKFVPAGRKPQAVIWTERRMGVIRVVVQDNGIGIPPEHHERIFRPFERLHPAEAYEGTGMGLAIVKKAVERMGGRIGVESGGEQGSRFWIELPEAR